MKRWYKRRSALKVALEKTGGRCWYCGELITITTGTIDHAIPVSKGGTDSSRNLLPACRACNARKRDMAIEAYRNHIHHQAICRLFDVKADLMRYAFSDIESIKNACRDMDGIIKLLLGQRVGFYGETRAVAMEVVDGRRESGLTE